MYNYLLFDLDGTLTDPKEGITKCVQYGLAGCGIDEPDLDKLTPFIGPPLKDSFMQFYALSSEQADLAIEKYRERFKDIGIFENNIYPGINEMLRRLKAKGKKMAIASSKPTVFVERILEHFEIKQYFDVVVGSELDGTRGKKEEVVEEALKQLIGDENVSLEDVAIIGDRKFDVEGGQANNITSIGVTYGYGGMEELKEAKADFIVRSVEELQSFLLRGTEDAKYEPIFNKVWNIVFPILIAYFVLQIGNYIGSYLILTVGETTPALGAYLIEHDAQGAISAVTGNAVAITSVIAYIITGIVLYKLGKPDLAKAKEEESRLKSLDGQVKPYLLAMLATVGISLGLNLLLELLGVTDKVGVYAQMQENKNVAALPLAIMAYVICGPIAEEIMFRGIVYNRMKKYMGMLASMIFSSLIYGFYNGSLLQGGYAFVIGLLIAFLYEALGSFYVPIIVHITASMCVYMLSYTGVFGGAILNWWVCIFFLLIGVIGIYLTAREKKIFTR